MDSLRTTSRPVVQAIELPHFPPGEVQAQAEAHDPVSDTLGFSFMRMIGAQ